MEIMAEVGFSEAVCERVASRIGKQERTIDDESQTLEDVACMVFLEFEFEAFAAKHERPKLIRIVQKTWKKISERARATALQLTFTEHLNGLVQEALS
ncbi:MAG: DUF4202 domain-containing protein [Myxococcales bacterium]|nr:DUF4202 domain-containing protein [Myxococcales bacterium]